MIEVSHLQLKEYLKQFYRYYTDEKTSSSTSIFIWGPPGIGKSFIVKEAAQELSMEYGLEYEYNPKEVSNGFYVIDRRCSTMEPSDLVIPLPRGDKVAELIPEWFPMSGRGFIFLDEFNLAPPLVQSAMYQLVLDRQIGKYRVPKGYLVVAAGNRRKDKCPVVEMSPALRTRFRHFSLEVPTVENWVKNFAGPRNFDLRVITFLYFDKTSLFSYYEKDETFPTPRGWEFVDSDLKALGKSATIDQIRDVVNSAVGEATALKFIGFLQAEKKIDLKKIKENPAEFWELKPEERYLVVKNLVQEWGDEKYSLGKLEKILKWLIEAEKSEKRQSEFGALLLRLVILLHPETFYKVDREIQQKLVERYFDVVMKEE